MGVPEARPAWPERVIEIGEALESSSGGPHREALLGEIWSLVHDSLMRYVRRHGLGCGRISGEDVRDIASDKAAELLRKLARGSWDPTATSAAQLCSFLSTLARNGLVDHLRTCGRERSLDTDGTESLRHRVESRRTALTAEDLLVRAGFVEALCSCAAGLTPRARLVWVLRVFHELPSRQIAQHPAVGMSVAGVDVTLHRCRAALRECMRSRGFEPRATHHTALHHLWESFHRVHA